ncbi:MAG: cyclic nucleotide-binding domain-containing protein [Gammaproteobacteria bacterium]|nr:cyclic nucleotide-binding domain-containing protein [Gammaproteobacteria bacterium]
MTDRQPIDPGLFSRLIPVNSLNPENFQALARITRVEELPAGGVLFREGDTDNHALYLLTGEVTVSSDKSSITRAIVGGSDNALYALSNLRPRQYTATARTPIQFIRLDNSLLDKMITWDQATGIEVTEFGLADGDTAWMLKLLQTPVFLRLPSANINALFERFEELPMKTGQIVIKQGDKGDYFYVIKSGRCRVVQKPGAAAPGVVVADLAVGDGFGEDALLSDAPRNATVAALTAGSLMRLAKRDFDPLLKEPLLQRLTQVEAAALVAAGALLIDVRLENEYKRLSLRGSVNIPLVQLRARAESLDKNRKIVTYCDTGNRSAAAAFLLEERGFDAYVLADGVQALREVSVADGLH